MKQTRYTIREKERKTSTQLYFKYIFFIINICMHTHTKIYNLLRKEENTQLSFISNNNKFHLKLLIIGKKKFKKSNKKQSLVHII